MRFEPGGGKAGDDLADAAADIEHARAGSLGAEGVAELRVEAFIPVGQDFGIGFVAAYDVEMAPGTHENSTHGLATAAGLGAGCPVEACVPRLEITRKAQSAAATTNDARLRESAATGG